MPTNSINETISAHDEGEDLPRMGSNQPLTSIARAIWSIRREFEDRCDIELEDCHPEDSVWKEAAAVLALSAAPQSDGWRPIAEAPKDEVVMLAAEFDRPGDWRMKCGYYQTESGEWRVWGASWKPTMWRPIPTPPKMTQTEGDE